VRRALARPLHRALAAAATLTGKRFGLLVASSLVATAAIVASALTGAGESGALAALIGRSLASNSAPVAAVPPPDTPAPGAGSSPAPSGSAGAFPAGAPLASPAPATSPPASGPVSKPDPQSPAAKPSAPTPEAGRIKHVFVVSLTSPGYEAAFGAASQMPYLSGTLRPQGQLLSGYSLIADAGLANSVAAIAGQPPNPSTEANCSTYAEFPAGSRPDPKGIVPGAGCVYPVEALTIADQLTSARLRWRAYVDGMVDEAGQPDNCVHPTAGATDQPPPGGYAARRNPFVYFHSLLDLGDCAINDLPLPQLETDLRKVETTANYSFVSPSPCSGGASDQCPEGAPSGATAADAFLSQWVPKILASPAYKRDGLLIVSFDEIDPATAATAATLPPTPRGVGTLLLSRFATAGAIDATAYDPYSLLRSLEDLFGLSHLGRADGAAVRSFAPALLGETGGD
jgi:phosphatidylinositol-3-phosphatase